MEKIKDINIVRTPNNPEVKYHTEGLHKYNTKEFFINLPLDPSLVDEIIHILINELKEGNKITTGKKNIDSLTCPISIIVNKEMFQIIFPDPFLKFPWEPGCLEDYKKQL